MSSMAERAKKSQDGSIEYRVPTSPSWELIRPLMTSHFKGIIPQDLEPHLIEWTVIRGQAKEGSLNKEQFDQVMHEYFDQHSKLFEDSKFSGAVKLITNRFSTAV